MGPAFEGERFDRRMAVFAPMETKGLTVDIVHRESMRIVRAEVNS